MLFDLQSRGRKTAVKIIYLGLAVLMGGGLLLFGVGTGTGQGGFFDIFSNHNKSTTSQVSSAETSAARQVRLHPQDPSAWYALAYARVQTAGLGKNYDQTLNQGNGGFTASGRQKLVGAASAWQQYLKLDPQHPNVVLARQMATAYSQIGLDQPANAAAAMEIVTAAQPSYAGYAALAQYAYLANQMRKGDLASAKAVSLAPSSQQTLLRDELANVKRQVLQQAARGGAGGGVAGTG